MGESAFPKQLMLWSKIASAGTKRPRTMLWVEAVDSYLRGDSVSFTDPLDFRQDPDENVRSVWAWLSGTSSVPAILQRSLDIFLQAAHYTAMVCTRREFPVLRSRYGSSRFLSLSETRQRYAGKWLDKIFYGAMAS